MLLLLPGQQKEVLFWSIASLSYAIISNEMTRGMVKNLMGKIIYFFIFKGLMQNYFSLNTKK